MATENEVNSARIEEMKSAGEVNKACAKMLEAGASVLTKIGELIEDARYALGEYVHDQKDQKDGRR